jgi:2-dehydro-3-deoxygalactonokinase
LFICPGLICRDIDGVPDVMRGEEVQIFGALSVADRMERVSICLPGTHSKHALIRNGRIECFLTHMTGEVFGLLREHSILGRMTTEQRPNLNAFDDGLRRARQPSGLLHHLFGVRTRVLASELDAAHLAAYLSGILIGHELASAPLQPPVLIVGESALCVLYRRALAAFGTDAEVISGEIATTRGLYAIANIVSKEHW